MPQPLLVLQLVIEVAFALLAVRAVAGWVREPDAPHGHPALALGALALLALVTPALGGTGAIAQALTDLAAVLFLVSGYGLLMIRYAFDPFGRRARLLILAVTVAVGVLVLFARVPPSPQGAHSLLQQSALLAALCVWTVCLCEPMFRFWVASIGRPAVQSHRLRALSLGYAALVAAVLLGTLASSVSGRPVNLVVDLVTLAVVPLLYIALFPPTWVRRVWRQSEEDDFRHALHDLLLYSPDRVTLAQRAVGWAARLVGGDSAYVVDADGSILAARGIGTEEAELDSTIEQGHAGGNDQTPIGRAATLVLPLELQAGHGAIVIRSLRLSPLFGDDELSRLQQYSGSIAAGLDRVSLTARVHALEKAKSEFLSVASHELRGPMTVIKGYLTMLEAGSLGALPARAQSALPLLITKSDEVNWMLEQMVEASRLEEGRLALKKRRLDIVDLTFSAVEGVKMLLSGHEVASVRPGGQIQADVDPDRFQIVVRNMLTNAAKYSPSGTQIVVEVRGDEGEGVVSVADQGVGISPDDQAHLFTRFGRIETTQHIHGTGLGLWLSREIARMHDGDLTVDSSVGHGSTFEFHLPLAG